MIPSIVDRIKRVSGVEAVVLGGSRARGTHTPVSDIDLGIYYHPDHPLDLAALNLLAAELDDQHRADLVTPIGGWGPWINGGGWLKIQGVPVDFLYRDLRRVAQVTRDCLAGIVSIDYQPGHPHGFVSAIYPAEVALCQPLWDPHGALADLKTQATPYPPALQQALIKKFFWEARFSVEIAHKGVARRDVAYIAGCHFRCVACLLQVLFALNRQYWMNEKGALALAESFPRVPAHFGDRVRSAFETLRSDADPLAAGIDRLEILVNEVEHLIQTL